MSDNAGATLELPPRTSIEDPGARELEASESEDHFSDAQSGRNSPRPRSPIPVTRVEKVDTEPSYGEVPGTDAYNLRTEDAQPDEIAVIDDDSKPIAPLVERPTTPGGHPIPKTVVENVDSQLPHRDGHEADAEPDEVVTRADDLPVPALQVEKHDDEPSHGEAHETDRVELRTGVATSDEEHISRDKSGSPTIHDTRSSPIDSSEPGSRDDKISPTSFSEYNEEEDRDVEGKEDNEEGFGDDFDDFEEGEEDADFGDFDDGFQPAEPSPAPPAQPIPSASPLFPILDFDNLDTQDGIIEATKSYMAAMFPPDTIDTSTLPQPSPSVEHPIFLTQRSASLWSQLVAPPPLQPPNWIRSRIRRLFLVSLGVPVDLDEILPASKQKKLILNLPANLSPSAGATPRASTDLHRLGMGDGNASTTSLDSKGEAKPSKSGGKSRRKGPPPAPNLDLNFARQLCSVTDAALSGMTVEELQEHVKKLEELQSIASEALDYWTKRTDEKLGDREAFEGVIENLVKHARKVRK